MFHTEQDLLANLIVLTPKLARRKFREHIFEAWEWKCAYCDKQLMPDTATIDHILPKHKGGHNVRSNMCCACSSCNRSKASRFDKLIEWMEQKPCSIKLPSATAAVPYISNDFYLGWVAT
jgi:hypothetical protein